MKQRRTGSHDSGGTCMLFLCTFLALTGHPHAADLEPKGTAFAFKAAEQACLFMPNSLKRILARNQANLSKGISLASGEDAVSPATRLISEKRLVERAANAFRLLRTKSKFSQVAQEFGGLASIVTYLNLPEGENLASADIDFVDRYLMQFSSSFRLVQYDAQPASLETLPELIKAIGDRRHNLSNRLLQAYPKPLHQHSLTELHPRSAFFGILALIYSHTINDVAKVWITIWKSANGDTAGAPNY